MRGAELFAAYKAVGVWPANKQPTDQHAPLPAVSSLDKPERVLLLLKLLQAHAVVDGDQYDINDVDDGATQAPTAQVVGDDIMNYEEPANRSGYTG
eukprot:COSAG01_NODE_1255_length_11040_cov_67.549584_11_plen_96_part_00